MTKQPKFEKKIVRAVQRELEKLSRKHGQSLVRYAATKWNALIMAQNRYKKERRALRAQLREIENKARA